MRSRLAAALVLSLGCALATAADYPDQTIRLIVPFAPGGTADIIARPLAQKLTEILGQSVVVVNRGGAGGALGASLVAQSRNDGYTLLLGSNGALTISQHLRPLSYDAVKDFAPIGMVATSQFVLVVHPSVPAISVNELIALAKTRELNYGSAGIGNVGHLAAELFDSMAGVRMVHVPYSGAGPMTQDLLAGRIALSYPGLSSMVPSIKNGKLRALAVTSKRRSSLLPEVPTLDEVGLQGYDAVTFWALLAPAGTAPEIVAKLNAATLKALASDDLRKTYIDTGNDPSPSSPQQLVQRIQDDTRKWADIVRKAGIAAPSSTTSTPP